MSLSVVAVIIVCAVLGFGVESNVMPSRRKPETGEQPNNSANPSDQSRNAYSDEDGANPGAGPAQERDWRTQTPDDWDMVLAVAPSASAAEIRAAYLRLIQQYHPDRFAMAAPEIAEYGAAKTKAINAAYLAAQRLGRV